METRRTPVDDVLLVKLEPAELQETLEVDRAAELDRAGQL